MSSPDIAPDWTEQVEKRLDARTRIKIRSKGWLHSDHRSNKIILLALLVVFLVIAVIVYVWIRSQEKETKWTLTRNESLPRTFPEVGALGLRPFLPPARNRGDLSPYIAYSLAPGVLRVMTNTSDEYREPYFVEIPNMSDVVMITPNFFCIREAGTCYYVGTDIDDASFDSPSDNYVFRNLTQFLVEIPLGDDYFLYKNEPCAPLDDAPCHVVLQYWPSQMATYAKIVMTGNFSDPSIVKKNYSFGPSGGLRAFHSSSAPKREAWYSADNTLSVFSPDAAGDVIKNVDADETVEILALYDDTQIVVVKKEMGVEKTRVRVYTLTPDSVITRRDEIHVSNRREAITALTHSDSYEICHVTRSNIVCFTPLNH